MSTDTVGGSEWQQIGVAIGIVQLVCLSVPCIQMVHEFIPASYFAYL